MIRQDEGVRKLINKKDLLEMLQGMEGTCDEAVKVECWNVMGQL